MNKPTTNPNIIQWLLLQKIDLTIQDKPRKENVVADHLSRMISEEKGVLVKDVRI
jgi:hypothetical protein